MRNYIMGFILSIALTLTAYFIVVDNLLSGWILIFLICILALVQFWIQLVFFLHIDDKSQKWNLAAFLTTGTIVFLIIAGSLWIMSNLNYRHGAYQTDEQIFQGEAIPR